jgi:pyridoxal 5'-phosphate synthase pdxS subunit
MADPTTKLRFGTELVKRGFAKMTQGGVIMDVTTAEQAAIAEEAGAVAVMALERVPADIRAVGGVARMADPVKIKEIQERVSIPVMAKCRIGHTAEAQILESLGVDMVDESEVLTPADPFHHVAKKQFKVPFVCGARNLGEALRRIDEGAAMIRTKGEAGTGNIVEAVRHIWTVRSEIESLKALPRKEVGTWASHERVPEKHASEVREVGRLPVVNFAAGGIATPADAALCRLLGVDGVFVGSGIFKAEHPRKVARAIVEASLHFDDPAVLARISAGLGEPMRGLDVAILADTELLQGRESIPASTPAPRPSV